MKINLNIYILVVLFLMLFVGGCFFGRQGLQGKLDDCNSDLNHLTQQSVEKDSLLKSYSLNLTNCRTKWDIERNKMVKELDSLILMRPNYKTPPPLKLNNISNSDLRGRIDHWLKNPI